ncbi:MAG: hypothetical protein ACREQA_14765 [Candidatus Binatia bacterium]
MVRELEVIGRVLQEEPPLRSFSHRAHPIYVRWVPLATALGVVLAILWGGMWVRTTAPPPFAEKSRSEDIWQFLQEVSTVVFLGASNDVEETSSDVLHFSHLRQALGEE